MALTAEQTALHKAAAQAAAEAMRVAAEQSAAAPHTMQGTHPERIAAQARPASTAALGLISELPPRLE